MVVGDLTRKRQATAGCRGKHTERISRWGCWLHRLAREPSIDDIPEDRPLSDVERSLVAWMLEHGEPHASSFLPQLKQARVSSRCRCGCASINFSVAGKEPPTTEMDVRSDYLWDDAEGHKFGAFVFAHGGLLAGLDIWSVDGAVTPTWIPRPDQLRPMPLSHNEV